MERSGTKVRFVHSQKWGEVGLQETIPLPRKKTIYYVLCGFLMSIGIVVPGVSSTVILMILGIYEIYLESISSLNLAILIPIGIGLIIGSLIWLKLIKFLLDKYNSQTFFAIIGFVFGSVLVMYPGFKVDLNGLSSILLFFLCIFISLYLEHKI